MNEFGTSPPIHVTITLLSDKFETDGTVQNVNKGRSGTPRSESVETVLQARNYPRRSL
jgi:hypothetical protein